jgi:hypothetical protein
VKSCDSTISITIVSDWHLAAYGGLTVRLLSLLVRTASCAGLKLLQDITAIAFRSFIELTTNRSDNAMNRGQLIDKRINYKKRPISSQHT